MLSQMVRRQSKHRCGTTTTKHHVYHLQKPVPWTHPTLTGDHLSTKLGHSLKNLILPFGRF